MIGLCRVSQRFRARPAAAGPIETLANRGVQPLQRWYHKLMISPRLKCVCRAYLYYVRNGPLFLMVCVLPVSTDMNVWLPRLNPCGVFAGVFTTALTAGSLAINAGPQADAGPKGVVELFTSQGCSSCPPADRLVSAMARNPDMIAVSFPVDYWDYIGWKDTLASPHFTARQKAYASVRGDGHVYTPQIVVDAAPMWSAATRMASRGDRQQ